MIRNGIFLAIFLLSATNAFAGDGIVRMRSDGLIIDEFGKITAVPDRKNSANDDYKKYYKSLGADGKPVAQSDFYIINDSFTGIKKVMINSAVPTYNTNNSAQQSQGGMVRKYDGTQTLQKSPDAPIYNDSSTAVRSVY